MFDGLGGNGAPAKIKLSQLFPPGKDSLIVYNFMFPRHKGDMRDKPETGETARLKREDGPCPSCTGLLDTLDRVAQPLEAAGFNFVVVAKAPLERLVAFARDREWKNLRMLSAADNSFKRDYHSESADGQSIPLMSVFHRGEDGIRHFWSSEMTYEPADAGQDSRQNGTVDLMWNMMDLTPEGRPDFREQFDYHEGRSARPARSAA